MTVITCPYSGCDHSNYVDTYRDEGSHVCGGCGKTFDYEVEVSAYIRAQDGRAKGSDDLEDAIAAFKKADLALDAAARAVRKARGRKKRDVAYAELQAASRAFRIAADHLDFMEEFESDEDAA